ncbi:hypothetical protein DAKH74_027650 [Maudiozyma humilis]|uniref:Uncharacterized protein n=1 Tax=Maudiozyma humilis TaxID=51915 RepID=A0AAV5S0A0_MAUHU|nr:hypothetical protein DAKH74_027650 [Kazachstania humilis]
MFYNYKNLLLVTLLSTTLALPVVKRDTIKFGKTGWYFDLTPTDLSSWAGAVHTVCQGGDPLVCLGESVVATVLTGIMAIGNGGSPPPQPAAPVTVTVTPGAEATSAADSSSGTKGSSLIGTVIDEGSDIALQVAKILNSAGITLLGLYNPALGIAAKDTEKILGAVIHFETKLGQHIAAQVGHYNFTKLAHAIANAVPGVPVFKEVEDDARKVVSWVSYTLEGAETDVAKLLSSAVKMDVSSAGAQVTNFIRDVEDFKFCLTPNTVAHGYSNETEPAHHSLLGEVYFNSYGLLESECK